MKLLKRLVIPLVAMLFISMFMAFPIFPAAAAELPTLEARPSVITVPDEEEDVAIEIWATNVDEYWEIAGFEFSVPFNTEWLIPAPYEKGTFMELFVNGGEQGVLYTVLSDIPYQPEANVNDRATVAGWDAWTRTGDSPWLDASDYIKNYITSSVANDRIGNFSFADIPAGLTPSTVTLRIKTWKSGDIGGSDQLKIYLYNGTKWQTYTVTPNSTTPYIHEKYYVEVDVTSFLDTATKVNAAKMAIEHIVSGTADIIGVDHAYLRVSTNWNLTKAGVTIMPDTNGKHWAPFPSGEGRLLTLYYTSLGPGAGQQMNITFIDITIVNQYMVPLIPPVARFTCSTLTPIVGELVTFDARASTPEGEGSIIVSYDWDFGDGATGSGVTTNHTYSAIGTYTVTLTVTDSEGLTDTESKDVKVIASPVAKFTQWPPDGYAVVNKLVEFNASESKDPDGQIITYMWDFGDGTKENTTYPTNTISHSYTTTGSFIVTLRVIDDADLVSQPAEKTLTVVDKRDIEVTSPVRVSPTKLRQGLEVTINATITNIGEAPETFTVAAYYNQTPTQWIKIGEKSVTSPLQPQENTTLTLYWDTSGVTTERYYQILVNVTEVYHETNVTNNAKLSDSLIYIKTPPPFGLDLIVDVGVIHFGGETAEFYILTLRTGQRVNVNILATLYFNGTAIEEFAGDDEIQPIEEEPGKEKTGLYIIRYHMPVNIESGTYTLHVEANYFDPEFNDILLGNTLKSFLVSQTLTGWNPMLISINGTVGTIKTDVGFIKANLTVINATLVRVEGTVGIINSTIGLMRTDISTINARIASINGTIVTIQTTLGIINGTITSIQDDIATIETSIGTIETILEEWTGGTTSPITTPLGDFRILVLTKSTLEGIAFSDNVLAITISGPSDTTGTTNIVIPKQLLAGIETSIDKIAATIDDEQVIFTYTEQPNTYLLQITYTHSTRTIKVYLTGLPPTPFPWAIFIAILVVTVIAAVGVVVYILKIRKPRIASASKSTATPGPTTLQP